ncbi:MAG: hypothetical protein Q8807_03895, partial ['Waltheria sp.' little leaf phytoplasma]|nr:hypothetical protein ['Waltheria sp.' little leaf phytoplasma]
MLSFDVNGSDEGNKMSSDLETMSFGADDLGREKPECEGCPDSSENKTELVPVPVVDADNSLMSAAAETNAFVETVNMDRSPLPGMDKSTVGSEENQETSVSTQDVSLNAVGRISEVEVAKTVSVEKAQVEESDVASPNLPVLETVTDDIQNKCVNKDDENHERN